MSSSFHDSQALTDPVASMPPSPAIPPQTVQRDIQIEILQSSIVSETDLTMRSQPSEDFTLKTTSPKIPAKQGSMASAFGLVEQMHYLYVRIERARDLFLENTADDSYDSFIEVRVGNYKGITKVVRNSPNPGWSQVFAFSKDRIYASFLEIVLRKKCCDEEVETSTFKGRVVYDVKEAPRRVPPDSPLAPQWYKLEGGPGDVMMAMWIGSQADEAFPEAWHSDTAGVSHIALINTKSKVYLSPKLWYLRVNVIKAQDLDIKDKNKLPEIFVKGALGNIVMKTKISQSRNSNPIWNEDMLFVAAEPFENYLILSVEEKSKNKEEVFGSCTVHLKMLERRLVSKPVDPRWYCLEKINQSEESELRFDSKILLRISLDGGYHVLNESTHYTSDLRPTVKQLWKLPIGVLELGILNANGLPPMKKRDGRGTTDAYCVAKYGEKWVRTRTIIDSSSPQWNEQYTWEVFDPCTVVTFGVFDNCHLTQQQDKFPRDSMIGKLRIRLSTLESYCQPILPKMHYLSPLSIYQLDYLRYQATEVLSMRLARSEPPLRKEVVEYMLDVGSHAWSTRRSRANCNRIRRVCSNLGALIQWFDRIASWRSPTKTITVHLVVLVMIVYPVVILPGLFLYMFVVGLFKYPKRAREPLHVDVRLSYADMARVEELDEEFDTVPSSKAGDVVRLRYDRMRGIGGRVQTVIGDVATQGERIESLMNWRDPRASVSRLNLVA
ncbi:hypothetical protein V2J09_012882 [Rumex salicifolius]